LGRSAGTIKPFFKKNKKREKKREKEKEEVFSQLFFFTKLTIQTQKKINFLLPLYHKHGKEQNPKTMERTHNINVTH
jgi:hypothetical protein